MKKSLSLFLFLPIIHAGVLFADVQLAPLFKDRMVLQRGKPLPVWGTSDSGEQITVRFAGQERRTVAGDDGRWQLMLEPLEASFEPAIMEVTGNNHVQIADVLVGEVWIASGQSNMEWSVRRSQDAALEIAGANSPAIREFRGARTVAEEPATDLTGAWQAALPEHVANFSAVAYAFARDLQQMLRVPVGIIHVSWGGTRIEAWLPSQSLRAEDHPVLASVQERWAEVLQNYPQELKKHAAALEKWQAKRDAAALAGNPFTEARPQEPLGPTHRNGISRLYNGMIHPLIPAAVAGFIWYQGESNAGRADEYQFLFPRMIDAWRELFGQGDLPFYWVQLANFSPARAASWPLLREAQTLTLRLPATGQAITIDIGDVSDIHPRNKVWVGRRLARLALNRHYGLDIVDSGPVMAAVSREGNGFRVQFSETHGGLKTPYGDLKGFELAGPDRVFHPATATVDGDSVVVVADSVAEPVAVRYAWQAAPEAGLFNGEDLPAVPFRSDNW